MSIGPPVRASVQLRGAVQGVGFRPFVYRLAVELGLRGWVSNSPQGVVLEAEGPRETVERFLVRLRQEAPAPAVIQHFEFSFFAPAGYGGFSIQESKHDGAKSTLILPDLATCADCLREVLDPRDRRYQYPFTNCTHCGPRFSIIEGLPYDRSRTSMKQFQMCPQCQAEYHDPADRRFHAQPNACPACGPHLEWWDGQGRVHAVHHEALQHAARLIVEGEIVALQGIGGFQLLVDATNEEAVRRLRARKGREEKPLGLLVGSVRSEEVSDIERLVLQSNAAPIVLLERTRLGEFAAAVAPSVAPNNPYLGVMLPCSPLHHLLARKLNRPVVATSGNLSDEPICIDPHEALRRLGNVADAFLVHDRPIVRAVDDSVVRLVLGGPQMLRRARGYAPMPIQHTRSLPRVLALGGHLKNSVALAVGRDIFLSQHVGDLDTPEALAAFQRTVQDLPKLYEQEPESVACDLHPDYSSSQWASSSGLKVVKVQHHYAHVLSCMAEHELHAPLLGVCWDGTGYGSDGTIWGGEFLVIEEAGFRRVGHFRQFRLPGGEAAVRDPRRAALGALYEVLGETVFAQGDLVSHFTDEELCTLRTMLAKRLNSPVTSSAGRLFDSVACLLGLVERVRFEGQAAMNLEFAIETKITEHYPFEIRDSAPWIANWGDTLLGIIDDLRRRENVKVIAARFHNTLVELIVAAARRAGQPRVVLTGGCFQNRYLTERGAQRLRAEGFCPFWHQRVPPNDGGLALGQAIADCRLPIAD